MRTLQDTFDPRRNSFDLLRLSFAVVVGVAHGMAIHTGWQPRWGASTLGDFALDGFFILSGFLVARSFLNLASFPRYVWHRALRIMPGFWVCLLVTALVAAPAAAALQGMTPSVAFTGDPSAWRYLFGNSGLLIVQYDISGILAETPHGTSFNGSLWTLFFEAFCYLLVAILGLAGVLTRRRSMLPVIVAVFAVLTVAQEAGLPVLVNDRILRLVFVFLLGTLAHLYADRIPMRAGAAAAAALIFLVSVALFDDYRVLGAAPLAYLFFWLGTCSPWPWSVRTDLSYGIYIYHWPLFQLLGVTALGRLPTVLFVPLGLVLVLVPASLSWHLIEKPALSHKHSPIPDRIACALLRAALRGRRTPAPEVADAVTVGLAPHAVVPGRGVGGPVDAPTIRLHRSRPPGGR